MDIFKSLTDQHRVIMLIFASMILLYFVFAPGANMLYYAGDDLRYAFGGWRKSCSGDDGFYFMLTLGRPLQAYMDCAAYKVTQTLEAMRVLRIFSVLLLGCVMGLFADWLYRLGFSIVSAFFAAGCFFIIPNLYNDTLFTASISLPFALLFAILAYRCLQRDRPCWWLATVWLTSSMLTYPAMSFFFATMILLKWLFSDVEHFAITRRQVLREAAFFIVIGAVYFIWAYWHMRYYATAPVTSSSYQFERTNFSLSEILQRIILFGSFFGSTWRFLPYDAFARGLFLTLVFVGGLVLSLTAFFHQHAHEPKRIVLNQLLRMLIGAAFLVLLSGAFVLIIPNRESGRLLFGVLATSMALLLWSIKQWVRLVPITKRNTAILVLITACFLLEGFLANRMAMVGAMSYIQRKEKVKLPIAAYLAKGNVLHRLHFIVNKEEYPYNHFFLANSALMQLLERHSYKVKWCSLPRGVPGAEKDHQAEMLACVRQLPKETIAITYTYPHELFMQTPDMLVIDMHTVSTEILGNEVFKTYYMSS